MHVHVVCGPETKKSRTQFNARITWFELVSIALRLNLIQQIRVLKSKWQDGAKF